MDLIIRNGTVVDGTGTPGRQADLAVHNGRIVAIGRVNGRADRTVDAHGLIVAPGFVDVHTHYDAQVLWDASLAPSTLHGVTTMIGGNCGFTLGQAGPEHADYLLRMLSRVEGIPLETLQVAVDWTWKDTAAYFARIEGRVGPNIGFFAGHSAIRRAAMGERAIGETATDADLDDMQHILRGALSAGALGFSSSNAGTHHDGAGDPVPSRFANEVELYRLCEVVGEFEGTTLEHIPVRAADEIARMATMSLVAGRPLNWNILQVGSARTDDVRGDMAAASYANAVGAIVRGLTLPGLMELRLTLRTGFIFDALPGWDAVIKLPIPERMVAFGNPATRVQLQRGAELAGPRRAELRDWASHLVAETFASGLHDLSGKTIGDIASERGTAPLDTLLDIAIADELRTVFMPRPVGDDDASWAMRAELWQSPDVLLGASDAGAHMDMLATFSFATTLLAQGVRERRLLGIEEAVRLITDWPARHFGLRHRGRIAEGWCADLVIFDPDTIGPGQVSTRHDLPAGAGRLFSRADGIERVIVNGCVLVENGQLSGDLPGRFLRAGRDTETVRPPGRTIHWTSNKGER
jgi:N-acyl-D-aspartate/D-glutamate deacylase